MKKNYINMLIAYDFDGTLAPGNMQEHQFLPDVGIKASDFWEEVGRITRENQADKILVYMNLMLQVAASAKVPVRRDDFKKRGKQIKLFDGVNEWFDRINAYALSKNVKVEHCLISSGNSEIFSGTSIVDKFQYIYASKFLFNENGVAYWPALAINYTTKTQYLFRINKGAHDISDDTKINEYVDKNKRPMPFENMIFIGDGATDIPCFRLMKEEGGMSIAVYEPKKRGSKKLVTSFLDDGRVNAIAPANYCPGSKLDNLIKANIDCLVSRYALIDIVDSN